MTAGGGHGWLRTTLRLAILLVAATSLAFAINRLVVRPLIPGRSSPLVRVVRPASAVSGAADSAGAELGIAAADDSTDDELGIGNLIAVSDGEPDAGEEALDGVEDAGVESPTGSGSSRPRVAGSGGFRALGPRTYVVSRAWLLKAGKRGPGAAAGPYRVDGKVKGYRLRGVSGPLARLGLRSGDVITAINGQKTDSPDRALRAYQAAYRAKTIRVSILRGGAATRYTYRIVD